MLSLVLVLCVLSVLNREADERSAGLGRTERASVTTTTTPSTLCDLPSRTALEKRLLPSLSCPCRSSSSVTVLVPLNNRSLERAQSHVKATAPITNSIMDESLESARGACSVLRCILCLSPFFRFYAFSLVKAMLSAKSVLKYRSLLSAGCSVENRTRPSGVALNSPRLNATFPRSLFDD